MTSPYSVQIEANGNAGFKAALTNPAAKKAIIDATLLETQNNPRDFH